MPRRELDEEEGQGLLEQPLSAPAQPDSNSNNTLQIALALVALGIALGGFYGLTKMFGTSKLNIPALQFTVVDGFFEQSSGRAVSDVYADEAKFGIVDADWAAFTQRVRNLVDSAGPDESYKVFFNARHGQGVHNVKEAEVGKEMWDCKWSLLEHDDKLVWGPDPKLTELGEQQAVVARDAWTNQLARGAPMPETYLTSPLQRSARTAQITWSDKVLPSKITIWERWREMIGLHTCDQRSPRSYIAKAFPDFVIDDGFTEEDQYWSRDLQEPQSHQDYRIHSALERVFAQFPNVTYVYTATHSGSITGFINSVGHREVEIQTGGMLPVVVKAVPSIPRHPPKEPWITAPPCPTEIR